MLVGSYPTGRTRGQLPARRLLRGSQACRYAYGAGKEV